MDDEAIRAFFGLEIADAVLVLITIDHPAIATIRVVNNQPQPDGRGDITSRGEVYQAFPFSVSLPDNTDEQPRPQLEIANVDRRISDSLENLDSSPSFAFEVIVASRPDDVLMRLPRFELANVTWDAVRVTGDLIQASFAAEPFGYIRVIPSLFPALYRS